MSAGLVFDMALFSLLGLGLETCFTAASEWPAKRDRHLLGFSSLWYIPLYALAPPAFLFLGPRLFGLNWALRGLIYTGAIYLVEFSGMLTLRGLLGSSPSEEGYRKCRWNVHGLIRLDFAPAWFAAGLFFERVWFALHPLP
jgi:hypothetical protein